MAQVNLLCGPFLEARESSLLKNYKRLIQTAPPGSYLWIAPDYRSIDALRHQLGGDEPLLATNFFTWQDFVDRIVQREVPGARPLSPLGRQLLAAKAIDDVQAKKRFAHFGKVLTTRGFRDAVENQLIEFQKCNIDAAALNNAIATVDTFRGPSGVAVEEVGHIYLRYVQLLEQANFLDPEGRQREAAVLLTQGRKGPFSDVNTVVVHGFASLTPIQINAFDALCAYIDELWISLPFVEDQDRQELLFSSKATVEQLQFLLPTIVNSDTQSMVDKRPSGLRHVLQQLFSPMRKIVPGADANGISLIEAPGELGEARLVARRIKRLLLDGVSPDQVIVVVRDIDSWSELIEEVFAEYDIDVDIEGLEPFQKCPAISTLLRMLCLSDEEFRFNDLTAILRSNYFAPDWLEDNGDPELPQHAEALLRLLGEPRGQGAYLAAVSKWADNPPTVVDDEQQQISRRQRTQMLAKKCRPFLEQFFRFWQDAPDRATLGSFVTWMKKFGKVIGWTKAVQKDSNDQLAVQSFWQQIYIWQDIDRLLNGSGKTLDRQQFFELLTRLTMAQGLPRFSRSVNGVRILSAETAQNLHCDYLFLVGLNERSFPRMASPPTLLNAGQKKGLRRAGVNLSFDETLLSREMLLFYQLIANVRRELVCSYSAVDDRGQEMLPSTFLTNLIDCFQPNTIPVERRNMLIEQFDSQIPLSMAEYRVQAALAMQANLQRWSLPVDMTRQMANVRDLTTARFRAKTHGIYDGFLSNSQICGEVAKMFSSERIVSPTALENYVACPFKFFLHHVLRLEPLEEPVDEIESTDRGLAFHRALSRLHEQRKEMDLHGPDEQLLQQLQSHMTQSVNDSNKQQSPSARMLWQLEGVRLKNKASNYREHWENFLQKWQDAGIVPRPEHFEIGFGLKPREGEIVYDPLVIENEGHAVKISGRIDRVDVATLQDGTTGFWIIDYKTGRGGYYNSNDLLEFRKLQLSIYALAVEKVLLEGQPAKPLGLAYWLVTDNGAKIVLPGSNSAKIQQWHDNDELWQQFRQELEHWVLTLVRSIREGHFPLHPRSDTCTSTCHFGQICRINQSRATVAKRPWALELPIVNISH